MDQARKLREMMESLNKEPEVKKKEKEPERKLEKRAKVISISSGKGGVGKTNFTINTAIALCRLGKKVVVLDADIGLGNVEILTGVDMRYSLSDVVFSDRTILNVMQEGPEGVKLISGGSGLQELDLLDDKNFEKILDELQLLQELFDYMIIDTGAGISKGVINFIMATDDVIIITTPDPTSVMDSYVLIKSLNMNDYKGDINIVTNLVKDRLEGNNIYRKLEGVSEQFLNVDIGYLGYMNKDDAVSSAVRSQKPFILSHPRKKVSRQVEEIASKIVSESTVDDERVGFAERLFSIFSR